MLITKIRCYEGKETRIEYTDDVEGKDEVSEHKRVSRQKPETSFANALQAFLPLLVSSCDLGDAWLTTGAITGLTFGSEKAKGGGSRMNLMIHARHTPEGHSAPILFNSPLMHEPSDDNMIGKPGSIPADWDDAIEEVKKQAIRFLQGHRYQADLPLAPAA